MSLLRRAVVNVPASSLLFALGLPVAWAVREPEWAIIKAIFVGPFLAIVAIPFFLVMHLLAAGAGVIAARFAGPALAVAALVAALVSYAFARGPMPSDFGDPTIARLVFVAAMTLPWLAPRVFWWPWHRKD